MLRYRGQPRIRQRRRLFVNRYRVMVSSGSVADRRARTNSLDHR